MTGRSRKSKKQDTLGVVHDFIDLVDYSFEKLTGKPISAWLKEFQQQPRQLPGGEQAAVQQLTMPLADAYAVLGLPPTATVDEVKKNYRALARVFHPDAGGYKEAMILLNNARDRIMKEKGGK